MTWPTKIIPIVEPIAIGNAMSTGRSQPLLMRCSDGNFNEDYIVKLFGNLELGKDSLLREAYATELACFFDLVTPDIAFVNINRNLCDSFNNSPCVAKLRQSIGLNFGSQLVRDAKIFSPPATTTQMSSAAKVFCFDLLLGNPDRRNGKPNMFDNGDNFILFDHEQGFPYSKPIMLIGGYPPGWEYIKESWHRNHVLYSSLKGKNCNSEVQLFIERLTDLDNNTLDEIENRIPTEWKSNDLINIRSYISTIRDNSAKFMRSLQECFQ